MGANKDLGLPEGRMEQYYIAFDIDGTLRNNKVDQNLPPIPNEDIRTFLIIARRAFKNIRIIVWSGSGKVYAHQIASAFGLDSYISQYMSKTEYLEFSEGRNIIAIDDIQDTKLGNIANLIVNMH